MISPGFFFSFFALASAQNGASSEALVSDLDADSSRLLTGALADATEIPNPSRQLQDLVTRLRDRFLDQRLSELTRVMTQPNLSEQELLRTLEEQQELQKQKNELLPQVPSSAAA